MWCRSCQQDVPGVASLDTSTVRCPRCRTVLAFRARSKASPDKAAPASPHLPARAATQRVAGQALPYMSNLGDDWETQDELRQADRFIRKYGTPVSTPVDTSRDASAGEEQHLPCGTPARSAHPNTLNRPSSVSSAISVTLLSLGLMSLVFGSGLLVRSCIADRTDLWRLGMPFALAGQAALALGLVFQLDNVWRSHRSASDTLAQVDKQLAELRHSTMLLNSTRNHSAQSFYLHMAEGASPHLLLSDLKGQLDVLAMKLAEKH